MINLQLKYDILSNNIIAGVQRNTAPSIKAKAWDWRCQGHATWYFGTVRCLDQRNNECQSPLPSVPWVFLFPRFLQRFTAIGGREVHRSSISFMLWFAPSASTSCPKVQSVAVFWNKLLVCLFTVLYNTVSKQQVNVFPDLKFRKQRGTSNRLLYCFETTGK